MTKFLYQPVHNMYLFQGFAENKACTDGTKVIGTLDGQCPSGYSSLYAKFGLNGHNGLDIMAPHGAPIFCSAPGVVFETETDNSGGIGVTVLSQVGDKYYKHLYWHLKSYAVSKGQSVDIGTILGYADNTGASSGDHLHYGLKECDEDGKTLNYSNGFKGAIDPVPFMFDASAQHFSLLRQYANLLSELVRRLSEKLRM